MHYRNVLILALLMLLSACNLTRETATDEPLATTTGQASGKPEVTIASPRSGSEVVVGDDVFVSATATDTVGVTEVQLIVNNQIAKRVFSESVSGDKEMSVLLDYKPATAGEITLQVIARRGSVASDPAEIDLIVRSTEQQVTATLIPQTNVPTIDPFDPTCRALVNTGLRLRSAPNTNSNIITVLPSGTVVPIIGRLGNNSWWQVRYAGNTGWLAAEFTTLYGVCSGVPIVATPAPPPPPTWTSQPPPPPPPTWTPVPPPTQIPAPADLVVSSIEGPSDLSLPAGEGAEVRATFTITISNFGGSRTGQFSNTITILPGGSPQDLGTAGNLRPSETVTLTRELAFTAPGDYVIRVQADSGSQVQESSKVNNTGTYNVLVTQIVEEGEEP